MIVWMPFLAKSWNQRLKQHLPILPDTQCCLAISVQNNFIGEPSLIMTMDAGR
jgi:hypothetical protein